MNDPGKSVALTLVQTKNPGGRPRGSKDRTKRVSPYKKAEAKSLYLAGHLIEDIAALTKIGNPDLIARWAREEHWDTERTKIMAESSSSMLESLLKSQLETFEGLQKIKEKSIERIDDFDPTDMKKYSEVVNAYISAVELEYRMKSNTLHARFLSEVARVLKDRIQDRSLLSGILDDLVVVYEGYTQKNLSEQKRESSDER